MSRVWLVILALGAALIARFITFPPAQAGGGCHPGPYIVYQQSSSVRTEASKKLANTAANMAQQKNTNPSANHRFVHLFGLLKGTSHTKQLDGEMGVL
jgi:hypothetical protein